MADTPPLKIVSGNALSDVQKKDLLHRLARIEGQLRGVQKLIAKAEHPDDCDGIAQQMSAARKALDRSFVTLLTNSLVTHAEKAGTVEESIESSKRVAALLEKFV
ncbi:metal-sensitive transcriptional regulator [Undibacterium sp. SXout20W]|uniref:metal-sensitive transcriptional regulator n=1 Tax=Undibacterium sp. SXout20W TaxID=3413051 RepID=UPI003BF008AC